MKTKKKKESGEKIIEGKDERKENGKMIVEF